MHCKIPLLVLTTQKSRNIPQVISLLLFLEIMCSELGGFKCDLFKLFTKSTLSLLQYSPKQNQIKEKQSHIKHARREFLIQLLPQHFIHAQKLCECFSISKDFVLTNHMKIQYMENKDYVAEEILLKIRDRFKAGVVMVEIARHRYVMIIENIYL